MPNDRATEAESRLVSSEDSRAEIMLSAERELQTVQERAAVELREAQGRSSEHQTLAEAWEERAAESDRKSKDSERRARVAEERACSTEKRLAAVERALNSPDPESPSHENRPTQTQTVAMVPSSVANSGKDLATWEPPRDGKPLSEPSKIDRGSTATPAWASRFDFWRGAMIGFLSAFPIFDMALNEAATVRLLFEYVGLSFF